MTAILRSLATALALSGVAVVTLAQTTKNDPKDLASVIGQVTIARKPAPNIVVVLTPSEFSPQPRVIARCSTNQEGTYKLTNVPVGKYRLIPLAPGFYFYEPGTERWNPGKMVNVEKGDTIKGMDFSLSRGGVITGQITNADNKPVVEQWVRLMPAEERDRKSSKYNFDMFDFYTDDRGIYRIYGLPAGRYLVFAGESKDDGIAHGGDIGTFYNRTYYPSATEESQAKVVEIAAGSEASGIDIGMGKLVKTYKVMGRVKDESGKPLPGIHCDFAPLAPGGKAFNGGFGSNESVTNENGEFQVKGLTPGSWGIFAKSTPLFSREPDPDYSDVATLDVTDSDVSGIQITMHPGSSISGILTLEATSTPQVVEGLSRLKVFLYPAVPDLTPPNFSSTVVNPDGSFQATGLHPGKIRINVWGTEKGYSLLRVERDGVEQSGGIDMRAGDQIRNLRLVMGYGTSVIRGQMQFEGGPRPEGSQLYLTARRVGVEDISSGTADVDVLGRFVFENLSAGDYQLTLHDRSMANMPGSTPPSLATQSVTVTEGGETHVTFAYNVKTNRSGND